MSSEMIDRKHVDAWVRKLNRLAAELEAEANSMHPSAWDEVLRDRNAKWRRIAASGLRLQPSQNKRGE